MPERRSTVVLTRRSEDTGALAEILHARGVEVLRLPCVRTEPLQDTRALAAAVAELGRDDLVVLTSRAGVDAVRSVAGERGLPCSIAAVGPATAARARDAGFAVLLTGTTADARVLGEDVPIPGGRILLARSDLADADLPRILRERGARVTEVVAYRTVGEVRGDIDPVRAALERGPVTFVVASPSAVAALAGALPRASLQSARFVAIGHRTAHAVSERIGAAADVAASTDSAAVASAILASPMVAAR